MRRRFGIEAGKDDQIGAAQRGDGFAQQTRRQETVLQVALRIQQHNIQITLQPAMLEAVIQENEVRMAAPDEFLAAADAVGIHGDRHTRQFLRQEIGFVAGFAPASLSALPGTDQPKTPAAPAIASGQHCGTPPLRLQALRQIQHQRSLACAAGG